MPTSRTDKKLIVITSGDPAGIGPETILKSLSSLSPFKSFTPLIIGDQGVFRKTAKIIKKNFSFILHQKRDNFKSGKDGIKFLDLKNIASKNLRFGVTSSVYGRAAMEYVLRGASVVRSVKGSALVTAPINKESIQAAGFRVAGHTEYLASLTRSKDVTMMLTGGPLKVSLVTRHIPIKDVSKFITKENIIRTTFNTAYALRKFFKIARPRIGIASLNPHAGEGGIFGKEEKRVIKPAADYLKRKIKNVIGPFPADTLFYKAYKGELDSVVCMYHDQGLIPLKMTAFEKGVNLTIGLPFIRTSPDHGTAFDIAGKGKANPSSMIEAIKLAAKIC